MSDITNILQDYQFPSIISEHDEYYYADSVGDGITWHVSYIIFQMYSTPSNLLTSSVW